MISRRVPSRRRFLQVIAGAAGAALLPAARRTQAMPAYRWTGAALGARASITLHHPNRGEARRIVRACLAEVRRLEAVFSLYRPDSALSRLNREGALVAPPPELVELLASARVVGERTGGAFDATVQPLWRLYRDHFSRPRPSADGPPERELTAACRAVDREAVSVDPAEVRLRRAGMALTLNGIAQGYVTDRVSALLHAAGFDAVLVDLGELRALGPPSPGAAWRVGLPSADGEAAYPMLQLARTAAVATSAPAAFVFEASGRHHHLFDPATGRCPSRYRAVTVVAPDATAADALSTAFALMDARRIRAVVARAGDLRVRLVHADGTAEWIERG